MVLCSSCTTSILVTQKRIKCSSTNCSNQYHQECIKLNDTVNVPRIKWTCPTCKRSPKDSPIPSNASPGTSTANMNSFQDMILEEIRGLRAEINKKFAEQQVCLNKFDTSLCNMQKDIKELGLKYSQMRVELDEVTKSVNFLSEGFDDHLERNSENSRLISKLTAENSSLKKQLGDVSAHLAEIEQRARDSNIELHCVPENKSENLLTIIHQLANTVSYQLSDNDLLGYNRVAKFNSASKRPRSIVIKMLSPRVRDNFLAAIKLYNYKNKDSKLNSSHLGFATKQPIYAMEHLSPANKQLHAATRMIAKEKKYEFLWIRGGKIFVRKNNKSEAKLVKDKTFLETL